MYILLSLVIKSYAQPSMLAEYVSSEQRFMRLIHYTVCPQKKTAKPTTF